MNIFETIWLWLKKVWNWLKNFFNSDDKIPTVKITIMSLLIMFFLSQNSYAQRTTTSLIVYFTQPNIVNTESWTVIWNSDSLDVLKSAVQVKNNSGNWVAWDDSYNSYSSIQVAINLNQVYFYDTEYTFTIRAKNGAVANIPTDSTKIYLMASDINKVTNTSIEQGYVRGNNVVDGNDLIQLARDFGIINVNIHDDINGDGNIDGLDLIQLARDFGRSFNP